MDLNTLRSIPVEIMIVIDAHHFTISFQKCIGIMESMLTKQHSSKHISTEAGVLMQLSSGANTLGG
jgi:hypothetical protein